MREQASRLRSVRGPAAGSASSPLLADPTGEGTDAGPGQPRLGWQPDSGAEGPLAAVSKKFQAAFEEGGRSEVTKLKRFALGVAGADGAGTVRGVGRAFVATGTNLSLQFFPASWQGEQRQTPTREYVDFEREGGKVYLKAPMILNGVCVIWKGWIDLQRLDGMGCLEFDEERAQQEDALAQQAFEEARRRTREFEDRDRSHREEMEVRVSQLLSVTGKKTARP
ncbi:PREDICTED: core-binding factor subunit beta [Pygoscelis adeliae]|uniref:core-binding factor subunit beta n=1 Tax=Pygoscelis adeliae TaxID=9238 RepID=UPI0004F4EA68|nr:PREDICTED: core-binding factor subunit beta [Pygoscelis adeliae]